MDQFFSNKADFLCAKIDG